MQLTADGCQEVAELPDTGCCPPPLCGNDLCCTFVAFFQILPSGPLWDYWKAAAISYFQRNNDPRQCPLLIDPSCPSLVLHAIYAVLKLRKMVNDALWPALRESDPMTAVTTLDQWLERLQWEDCFLQACRSRLLGGLTPYEIMSDCGPLFCPPNFSPELTAALKHNIVRALTRANMGVIKNLCGLSWVIEPLGAEVRAVQPYMTAPVPVNWCDPGCPSGMKLMVVATRDWIEGAGTGDLCEPHPLPRIKACFDRGCDVPAGLPAQIWPGLLAAECIIRSLAANMVCKQEFITLVSPPCFACPVDPAITSPVSISIPENTVLVHNLTANKPVTWTIVGGADASKLEISGSTLRWAGNGTKDFEAPDDIDANNTYVVQVQATDDVSETVDQTITVTVTDVDESVPAIPTGFIAMGNFRDGYDANKRYIMPPMSLDGVEFTTNYPERGILYYGASNGSRIVAYGADVNDSEVYSEVFWHSDDQGRTWTAVAAPHGPDDTMVGQLFDACWDGARFIFVGNDGSNRPIAMKSPDGVTWTTHFVDSNNDIDVTYQEADLYGIAYGNGAYVAVGTSFMDDEEAIIYRSMDTITWTKTVITVPPIASEFEDVVWNGSLFVAVGYDDVGSGNALVMTSPNGVTWTKRTVPVEVDGQFYGVGCKPDGMCVAVGERWAGSTPCVAVSPDGMTWTAVDIATTPTHDVATCYNVAWNGSLWCAVGDQTISFDMAFVMTSPDGVTWTIRQIIGNQISTFLGDVVAATVNPVVVDLSHRTDVFSLSVWIKGADDGQLWGTTWPGDNMTNVQSLTNGQFFTWIRSADFSELVEIGLRNDSAGMLIDPLIWSHVLFSVNTNHPQGSKIFQLWVNDVDMLATNRTLPPTDNSPAFSMKWHGKPFVMNGSALYGSPTTPDGPYAKFDVAEAWFAPGQFIDFSVVANRRKFISAGGAAVGLGADGSLPTGVAPAVYFSGDATTFPVNKGTGGAFTKSGTITNAPTSPSGATAVSFVSGSCLLNPSLNAP